MRARVCAGTCRLQSPRVGARDKDDSDYGWMASPIGGKTATLVTSPGALPWWCETVGMGIGRTGRLSCSSTPKVRSLDGVARALLCVELKPCMLPVALL